MIEVDDVDIDLPLTKNFLKLNILARNVIENLFGSMKNYRAILNIPSYYPIKIQNCIFVVCPLLHKYIEQEIRDYHLEDDDNDDGLAVMTMKMKEILSLQLSLSKSGLILEKILQSMHSIVGEHKK